MFMKNWACFLFLDPQDKIGPSISSSAVLCSFVLLVYIVTLVLVFYLCPSSVCIVATFPGTVLFPLLYSVLPFSPLIHWFFSLSSFVNPSKCLKIFICAASKRCSYPGDIKTLLKSSKGRGGPTLKWEEGIYHNTSSKKKS